MTNPVLPAVDSPITSEFAEDPEFADLLQIFSESVVALRFQLLSVCEKRQWADLERLAHQLKGAGGGYGFPGLSERASALEICCQKGDEAEIPARVDEILAYMDRIRV